MTVYVDTPLRITGRMAAHGGMSSGSAYCRLSSDWCRMELRDFTGRWTSQQAPWRNEPGWHVVIPAGRREEAITAGAVPIGAMGMRSLLLADRAEYPGDLPGEAGASPGTACCLECWWRCRSGMDACARAAAHGRETGHATLARDLVARSAGALFAAPERTAAPLTNKRGPVRRAPQRGPIEGQAALFEDVSK